MYVQYILKRILCYFKSPIVVSFTCPSRLAPQKIVFFIRFLSNCGTNIFNPWLKLETTVVIIDFVKLIKKYYVHEIIKKLRLIKNYNISIIVSFLYFINFES